MTIEEAVLALKRYQGYEPMEDGNILKHSFDLTDETVDTLLSAMRTETAGEPLTLEQLQHMDEQRDLARRMREMAVNTGGLNCLGCGYEHKCGVHGCVVLKRAADLLDPAVDITTPIPLNRLRELVEADRDGRCVVLPCHIGDPVFMGTGRSKITGYEEDVCDGFYIGRNGVLQVKAQNHKGNHGTYGVIGQTAELTHEAAEAALKGDQHEQNL